LASKSFFRRLSFAAMIPFALLSVFYANSALGGDTETLLLFASPEGNDVWSGRLRRPNAQKTDGPLASMIGARDAVRGLRGKTGELKRPVRIEFANGVYRVAETVIFTPADSGTNAWPITYVAAPGATPNISGGRVITGWRRNPSGPGWMAKLPDADRGRWRFRQLFVNGVRYVRAREPDREDFWFRAASALLSEKSGALLEFGDLKRWRRGDEVEAVLLRVWDSSRLRVSSADWENQVLWFDAPEDSNPLKWWKNDRRWYLENSLSFLDSAGEWYLDTKRGIVYLVPLARHKIDRARIVAPAVERLIHFEGNAGSPLRHIRFRGLAFSHSALVLPEKGYVGHQADVIVGAAIEGDFVEFVSFEDCRFERLGRYAVWLRKGCGNNTITRCEFNDLGCGAVQIGESIRGRIQHKTTGNAVTHNSVHDCGRILESSVGIWVGAAAHTRIAHNHVYNLPYSGISVGWMRNKKRDSTHNNIIEFNHVHDVMQSMSDGGGIYMRESQPGTVIRNNIIHDCPSWQPNPYGNGIYLDSSSADMRIESNLVCRVGWIALTMGKPGRNTIRNNIFAFAGRHLIGGGTALDNVVERNILVTVNSVYDGLMPNSLKRCDGNIYFHPEGKPVSFAGGVTPAQWRAMNRDVHSIVADPGFTDLANGDFTFKSLDVVRKVGFKPFAIPRIGSPRFDYDAKVTAAMRRTGPGRMTQWPLPRIIPPCPSSRIVIDGRMAERAWNKIKSIPLCATKEGPPHDPPLHRAKVAFDGRNLYVIIVTDVPDMSRLHADGAKWDKHDWAVVSFQGVTESALSPIFSVHCFASGTAICHVDKNSPGPVPTPLKRGVRYAAKVRKKRWTAELKIPITAAGINIRKVKELRFNMSVRRSDAPNKKRKWGLWVNSGLQAWHLKDAGVLLIEKADK